MPIAWKPAATYDDLREEAERRIAARDPDDWPTVALALKLDLPV
jgi:predicted nucleic acid-binding protein